MARACISLLSLLILTMVSGLVCAAAAASQDGDPLNAATWYRRARDREQSAGFSRDDWMALYEFDGDTLRPPLPHVRALISRLQPAINITRRAARMERSDFGVDYTDPEFGNADSDLVECRSLLKNIRFDMALRLHDGDYHSAVDRIVTAYRMAGHMSREATLIGPLIGAATITFADRMIDAALDYAAIGPGEAALLLKEVERYGGPDPMRIRATWAIDNYGAQQRRLLRERGATGYIAQWAPVFEREPEAKAALERMTEAEISAMLDHAGALHGRLVEATANPDLEKGKTAAEMIWKEVADDRRLTAQLISRHLGRPHQLIDDIVRTRKQLDDRKELLTGIAEGRIDPMSLANAAVWYVRAAQALEKVDPEKTRLIDSYAAANTAPPSDEVREVLASEEVVWVLSIVREGASMQRCDFSRSHAFWPYSFKYFDGYLLALSRLVVADAARLLHDGSPPAAAAIVAAAQDLETGYRMAAHLAPDGRIASSLTAHHIFLTTDHLVERTMAAGLLQPEQIARLAEALKPLRRADPFHYQPVIAKVRESVANWALWLLHGEKREGWPVQDQETIERVNSFAASCTTDQAFTLLVMYDSVNDQPDRFGRDLRPELAGAGALYDMEAVQRAIDLAPGAQALLRARQPETLAAQPLPVVAAVSERAAQSQRDLWRALRRFGLSAAELEPDDGGDR